MEHIPAPMESKTSPFDGLGVLEPSEWTRKPLTPMSPRGAPGGSERRGRGTRCRTRCLQGSSTGGRRAHGARGGPRPPHGCVDSEVARHRSFSSPRAPDEVADCSGLAFGASDGRCRPTAPLDGVIHGEPDDASAGARTRACRRPSPRGPGRLRHRRLVLLQLPVERSVAKTELLVGAGTVAFRGLTRSKDVVALRVG
jgi:hypothetical protein